MRSTFLLANPRHFGVALAILRVITGIIFTAHGWQKLFVFGLAGTTGGFTQMGIPFPGLAGPVVSVVELLAGVLLVLGVVTRLAGFVLAIDMLGAILLVHARAGFFLPAGAEFALAMFAAAIALAIGGPGAYSLDAAFAGRRAEAT